MTILGVIPARGGSRRVKKKNIKELGGRPLIAYTIEAAKKAKTLDYFLVSTDDPEIAKISKAWGARVPFKRPAKISEDIDTSFVAQHAINWFEKKKGKEVSYVVILQPTSPFRTHNDIDRCVQLAIETKGDSIISVVNARQHPYWCFELDSYSQRLYPLMGTDLKGDILVSQNLPLVLYPNGAVYVVKRDLLMEEKRIFGDKIYPYLMPESRSIDLETETDFVVASALIPLQKKNEVDQITWIVS